ncbi:MAG: hypothetical protein GY821_05470 [Gammaproteobacteria bacterium]|nr:hypothetical protein [Gammaproteobacteria bacterium]
MKIVEIYSNNGLSYFREIETNGAIEQELGCYSNPYAVGTMQFRQFDGGRYFDWHPAPRAQYIFYLQGEVKVTASGNNESRIFTSGEILFANDTTGKGHISQTLSHGRAVIVTAA